MRLQFVEPCFYKILTLYLNSTYKYLHHEANQNLIEIETGRLSSAIRFQRVARVGCMVAQRGGSERWLRGGSVVWLRWWLRWWLRVVAQRGGSVV